MRAVSARTRNYIVGALKVSFLGLSLTGKKPSQTRRLILHVSIISPLRQKFNAFRRTVNQPAERFELCLTEPTQERLSRNGALLQSVMKINVSSCASAKAWLYEVTGIMAMFPETSVKVTSRPSSTFVLKLLIT